VKNEFNRYTATFTAEQVSALRALSARTRVSVARHLREAVDDLLAKYGRQHDEARAARTARAPGITTPPTAKRRKP
jgi:hypothetical protein